jgi:hypothetical protein
MVKSRRLSMPELGLLVGTRFLLGLGIGLLLAGRMDRGVRIGAGRALAAVGVLTTIPLALLVLGSPSSREPQTGNSGGARAAT